MALSNTLSSNTWALVSGVVVVAGALGGAVVWQKIHPDALSPFAALAPVLPQFSATPPAPANLPPAKLASASHAAASSMMAKSVPVAAPPAAVASKPMTLADRGPEPPSAPNPDVAPAPAPTPQQAAITPTFDVVRVEPSGDSVVAGKGEPGADVSLLASGQVVAEAKADQNGQFVMTPPALKPGSYDLTLQQTTPGQPAQRSAQAVAVAVPETSKGQVVVALDEPGKPTKVLSAPAAPAAPVSAAPAAPPQLAIRSAELENGTGFFTTGSAPPGSHLHVYLNDSHLADITAAANGDWTLRIGKGLTGGRYTVRADAVGADGKAIARAEVPFDVPVAMAQAPAVAAAKVAVTSVAGPTPPNAPTPDEASAKDASAKDASAKDASAKDAPAKDAPAKDAPATPTATAGAAPAAPSDAVVLQIDTARVVRGDNLWDISRTRFGDGTRYTRIYTANADQIRDPNLIYPGQVFVVPRD